MSIYYASGTVLNALHELTHILSQQLYKEILLLSPFYKENQDITVR